MVTKEYRHADRDQNRVRHMAPARLFAPCLPWFTFMSFLGLDTRYCPSGSSGEPPGSVSYCKLDIDIHKVTRRRAIVPRYASSLSCS